jgi:hypothetical protein
MVSRAHRPQKQEDWLKRPQGWLARARPIPLPRAGSAKSGLDFADPARNVWSWPVTWWNETKGATKGSISLARFASPPRPGAATEQVTASET